MKLFAFLLIALNFAIIGKAQDILKPGDNTFERKWIRNGKSEMGYYVIAEGNKVEIGSFIIDVKSTDKTLAVYTTLKFANSDDLWIDTCISDGNTFKPMYRSSFSNEKEYMLKYGAEVTGSYFNKLSKKRSAIKEPVSQNYFDNYTYPYLLGLLPLNTGYRKDLVVYEYKPDNGGNIKKARIEEVKNNVYVSSLTGEHKVWQVSVFEEATNDSYEYYIDKDTRRIWKIEILTNKGQKLLLVDKEPDYNPFTNKFDKAETLKLIKDGSAVISGEAFARDNQSSIKGIAVLNVNKRQFARAGTKIILIPYTNFFKEWMKLNETSRKKGRPVPLPVEATECIKVTTVYDDKGRFEFVNLMPGDYLLYTEFGYVHKGSVTNVIGYTDTYINGMFQGSSENTETHNVSANASATVKKIVTIKNDGEKVNVKLKKTL